MCILRTPHGDSHKYMVAIISPAQELQVDVYLEDAQGDSHYDMVALISPE